MIGNEELGIWNLESAEGRIRAPAVAFSTCRRDWELGFKDWALES
jgi:hypothetical protein